MTEKITKVELTWEDGAKLFDLLIGSMDWGSGFLDKEDVDAILAFGGKLGIEGRPDGGDRHYPNLILFPDRGRDDPHPWHQDCALFCGRSAGHPIHFPELPK